ncbi:MAG TPA: UTRA domain-containing protein [Actinomycetes bacterium]
MGHHDEVTARMPTPDELRTLELGSGVPVLVYVRTAYTKERPIRLTENEFCVLQPNFPELLARRRPWRSAASTEG